MQFTNQRSAMQCNAMLKTFLRDYGFTTNDEFYYSKKLTN